jgi:transposase-like protein
MGYMMDIDDSFYCDDAAEDFTTEEWYCPHCKIETQLIVKEDAETGDMLYICPECRTVLTVGGNPGS